MGKLTLIIGGSNSEKSKFAEGLVKKYPVCPVNPHMDDSLSRLLAEIKKGCAYTDF